MSQAWRVTFTVEMETENNDVNEADDIARAVWERCSPLIRDIDGVRWMLPVAEFTRRKPFSVPKGEHT